MSRLRSAPRTARVRAFAKINLALRVLGKRADGFHELRTVFQTISLADTLEIAFTPSREIAIELDDQAGIPDNLVVRAARQAMEAMGVTGRVEMRLAKRIPMGAGLGGGSSDAAAVLLALPALARRRIEHGDLMKVATALGSDVPFFLLGGAAAGIGRGEELFPLPDVPPSPGLLIAPDVHVETPWAYRALSPRLTFESQQNKIVSFQAYFWNPIAGGGAANDFEEVVFERFPRLASLKAELIRAGALSAMMTGSGSALFGLFRDRQQVAKALRRLTRPSSLQQSERVLGFSLVSRARYRSMWRRALGRYASPHLWPPQTRQKQSIAIG
jgi:4-diphosphocytidyl-2-C-methyl-D-erythritol kinase